MQRNHREAQKCVVTAVAKDEKWSNKFVKLKDGCLRQEDKWYDLTKDKTPRMHSAGRPRSVVEHAFQICQMH